MSPYRTGSPIRVWAFFDPHRENTIQRVEEYQHGLVKRAWPKEIFEEKFGSFNQINWYSTGYFDASSWRQKPDGTYPGPAWIYEERNQSCQ